MSLYMWASCSELISYKGTMLRNATHADARERLIGVTVSRWEPVPSYQRNVFSSIDPLLFTCAAIRVVAVLVWSGCGDTAIFTCIL